ncbi:MAG: hypothetical protein PHF38_04115 [Bacteroidales bacterium]|nr:hypothetical protein [Bacteroidales bacterium]MDD4362321.1 hypothetical protein [Bacteroidales bacterium]
MKDGRFTKTVAERLVRASVQNIHRGVGERFSLDVHTGQARQDNQRRGSSEAPGTRDSQAEEGTIFAAAREAIRKDKKKSENDLGKENNSKSANKGKDNGIPESVSQREHRAKIEANSEIEETTSQLRERIKASERDVRKDRETLSREEQIELENRTTEKYAKENSLWIPMDDVFDLGRTLKGGNEKNRNQGK